MSINTGAGTRIYIGPRLTADLPKDHAAAITLLAAGTAMAQANDTLAKIKGAGSITLGVRESSGLSYTLGGGKYVGFHTEMAEVIIADLQMQLGLAFVIAPNRQIKQPVFALLSGDWCGVAGNLSIHHDIRKPRLFRNAIEYLAGNNAWLRQPVEQRLLQR